MSNHLKTSDHSGVRDVSLSSSGGVVTQGNPCGFAVNLISQSPNIPEYKDATEVSLVEGAVEPCSAVYADQGTDAVREIATKAAPVVANLDEMDFSKVSVRENPGMMRAHQLSSPKHGDGKEACEMPPKAESGIQTITSMAGKEKGADCPVVADLGRSTPMRSR